MTYQRVSCRTWSKLSLVGTWEEIIWWEGTEEKSEAKEENDWHLVLQKTNRVVSFVIACVLNLWNGIGLTWIGIMLLPCIQTYSNKTKVKDNTFIFIIFYYANLFLRFEASCRFQFYKIGSIVRILSPFNRIC